MNLPKLSGRLALGAICLLIASCSAPNDTSQVISLSGGVWLEKSNGTAQMLTDVEVHLCALPLADDLKPELVSSLPPEKSTLRDIQFKRLREDLVQKQDYAKQECLYSTRTDMEGKYVFEDISSRIYTLYASASSEDMAAWWIIEYLNLRSGENLLVLKPNNATRIITRHSQNPSPDQMDAF
ncbi:MAG: hypothetical protein QNJ46_27595 [Leptolyngbyaceae cyanobacterium MO_188.B28]|nr:hypothetical protein [Leptolyngbyaceae cyanobacterium MO_188.B28]